jgi:hypothetical protein
MLWWSSAMVDDDDDRPEVSIVSSHVFATGRLVARRVLSPTGHTPLEKKSWHEAVPVGYVLSVAYQATVLYR